MEMIELRGLPPDKVLFNEVLCVLEKNRFKKLQVKLTKLSSQEDVAAAFQLEICGLGHKYHLKFDFTKKDLCFLRRDERPVDVQDSSCLPCIGRNFYVHPSCTRLLLIWLCAGECIKVPFIQRGNLNAATTLQKLENTIYEHVVKPAELKHWQVYVKECGGMSAGQPLFLAITKFALIIIYKSEILYYHSLLGSHFTTKCSPEHNLIDIEVKDKAWITNNQESQNFALTWKYSFSTVNGRQIEMDLMLLQRQSLNKLGSPARHFNIQHCERSASDFVEGTTSDNMLIPQSLHYLQTTSNTILGSTSDNVVIPHRGDCVLPSGGSTGSNGHIPNTISVANNKVIVHDTPKPHPCREVNTSSSNGHIPGSGGSSGFISQDILRKNNDRPRFDLPDISVDSTGDSASSVEGQFIARGHTDGDIDALPLDRVQSETHPKILVQARTSSNTVGLQGSKVHLPSPISPMHRQHRCESESSPLPMGPDMQQFHKSHNDNDGLASGSMGDMAIGLDISVDDSLLPPPPPCGARTHPVAYISCWSFAEDKSVVEEPLQTLPPLPRRLLRSQSVQLLNESEIPIHSYVNTERQSMQLRNIHDDSPYYRFYYNYGFIRMTAATMSTKLKRRRRLSKDMVNVDYNLLDKHEMWFDECYKMRDKDLRFRRLSRMNIEPQQTEDTGTATGYSELAHQKSTPDDPYWNGDLCITLQAKLQKKIPNVQEIFDITHEQLLGMQVLLSLVPSESNWKDLAEYIGLVSKDISIIEHFCYTYRELAAEVVLTHWTMQCQRQKSNIVCTRQNLLLFLDEIGREDITNILLTTSDNVNVQTRSEFDKITNDFEVTHF